jgi:hypothetical protein
MCKVTRHHTRKHHISTEVLEAKFGIHNTKHNIFRSRVVRYAEHALRMNKGEPLRVDRYR